MIHAFYHPFENDKTKSEPVLIIQFIKDHDGPCALFVHQKGGHIQYDIVRKFSLKIAMQSNLTLPKGAF